MEGIPNKLECLFYALWSDNVAQEALFCNLKGSVSHCKRACFEAQGKLFCNVLVIKLLRSSHLAYLLLCIFRYSFLFKLHSLLASCRIHLHHQAMRKTVSLLLFSLTTTSQILFFQQEKTLFRFSFSIKKMYLCVLNKTRTIYIVQKNK